MEVAAGTEPIKPLVVFVHPNEELEVKKTPSGCEGVEIGEAGWNRFGLAGAEVVRKGGLLFLDISGIMVLKSAQ